MADEPIRVTVWGEGRHEKRDANVAALYPEGMHETIAAGIAEYAARPVVVRCTTLDSVDQGLPPSLLESTDVLTWWGHMAHDEVSDDLVDRVQAAVLAGMGLVVLHSGHWSKIFKRLMGTSCALRWRNGDDRELVWTVDPTHPVAAGVPSPIVIDRQEMYGEFFDIPAPDELVFVSSFSGGEVFRSGCAWRRGRGRVFYFSPGDQDYPVYHHPDVRRVIANAAVYVAGGAARDVTPIAYAPVGWYA
ncbi:ThuA domain-containing protein [Asanoa iriomotensis]|uniref:Trehalose utilization protein ThuA n=1 Tax=Asanoa iriomotensis TaxID=234613 RepID=A0ABQ4CD33_9ACTN|nr:ThuA domain-containing protein [Asanoa iriomotensis]GIF60676.1 trehalose utilization protein ThuA [Asanoa iriomotensis]